MENPTDTFQTSDIKTSVYLLTVGIPLIRVIKDNPSKIVFCFSPSPQIKQLLQDFWTNRAKVSARALFDNWDYLKDVIHRDYDL